MELKSWKGWLSAAGIVAALALPSVGTFYALRIEYPEDPLLLGLAVTSWCLVASAAIMLIVAVVLAMSGAVRRRRAREKKWAARGSAMRDRLAYLERIAEREASEFVRMHVAEQEHRDAHGGRSGSHIANAERLLKQAEAVDARTRLADAREEYLATAPRAERRRCEKLWSIDTATVPSEGVEEAE